MKATAAGPDGCFDAGREYDLPRARAAELVASGAGEYVDPPPAPDAPAVERAVREPAETSTARPQRGRRAK